MATLCFRPSVLPLVASLAALLPTTLPASLRELSHTEVAALHAGRDPGLGSLRAGRVSRCEPLDDAQRAELRTVEQQSATLASLRAGGISDDELKWILIGAGIVLLIVLIA